ncbi:MAG TPA: MFS transporter [Hyphomicrobiaceae bacterium]|nr:MFS transporter [Hyphomicrobiaceae bacterium]
MIATDAAPDRYALARAITCLGITQIIAWGTTYYCLGVLSTPIGREMGWSASTVFTGFAVALLSGSAASTTTGFLIDTYGARAVMTAGSVAVSIGLYALSGVVDLMTYLITWAYLGIAMRLTLYDAAFAAIVQVAPDRGRRGISYLTLWGGFASSVFWPIGHYLNGLYGWRQTLAIFAVFNLVACVPLHWFGITRHDKGSDTGQAKPAAAGAASAVDGRPLEGRARSVGIALFALVMSFIAFVFSVTSVQLVHLLEQAGLATAAAVWLGSLKGVAQVGGRILELTYGSRYHPMTIARIAIASLAASVVLLIMSGGSLWLAVAFTVLTGAAQGVLTIVRGAVPLALFGASGYASVLGLIATPILVVSAASPIIYPWIVARIGPTGAGLLLLASSAMAVILMELMSRWYDRQA